MHDSRTISFYACEGVMRRAALDLLCLLDVVAVCSFSIVHVHARFSRVSVRLL